MKNGIRLNMKVWVVDGELGYEDDKPKEIANHPNAELLDEPLEEWAQNYPERTLELIAAGIATLAKYDSENYHIAWNLGNKWGRIKP